MTKEDTIPETALEIEDLEIEREIVNIDFEIGDNVVYPHHGAGQVVKKEEKNILGEVREYLTIKILHNDMTVMVPCENAGKAGLRRVIDEETVKKVLAVLAADVSEMPKNWNRRFKHNRDKIKTGDIYELAEVVRNLAVREQDKGLSTGEKQMYTRAKKILASEMMYALEKTEDEAEAYLDEILLRTAEQLAARAVAAALRLRAQPTRSRPALSGGRGLPARGSAPTVPKAFVEVAGRPMLEWSLDALRAAGIDGDRRRAARGRRGAGGLRRRARRRDALGVRARRARAPRAPGDVVVHDAARPLVEPELFTRVLDGAGATPTARSPPRRVTDTVKEADGRRRRRHARPLAAVGGADAAGVPPRGAGGRAGRRRRDPGAAPPTTPGSSSAPAARVRVVESSPANFKVTTPHDLRVADTAILRERC